MHGLGTRVASSCGGARSKATRFASVLALVLAQAALAAGQSAGAESDVAAPVAAPASRRALASASEAVWLSPKLNADPNGAAYGLEYRGAMRGRFSDAFELYGGVDQPGYGLTVTPMFELHEPRGSSNVLPSQYWRARVSIEQSYGFFSSSSVRRFRVGLLLDHESDHETAHQYSRPGFLALNDVTLRAQFAERHEHWTLHAGLDAQLFLVSCTQPSRPCRNFRGDTSAGGQAQVELGLPSLALWRFEPFAAASGSGILAHGLVRSEARLSARLGFYARFGDSLLALFALLWLGNDVGVVRNRTLRVAGAGISFAR